MKYKKIIISGKVQGVGFREFLRREIIGMGNLVGYVKNLNSGDVVIVINGDETKIKKIADKCKNGPLLASVKNVSIQDIELEEEFESFIIKI